MRGHSRDPAARHSRRHARSQLHRPERRLLVITAGLTVAAILVMAGATVAAVQMNQASVKPVQFDPAAIPVVPKMDGASCEDKRTFGPIVGGFDCDLAESPQAVLRWYEDRLAREGWTFEGVAQPIVVEGMWTRGDFIVRLGVVRFSGSTNLNLTVLRKRLR